MTAAPLPPETQRRLDAKAERLSARIWRVFMAELKTRATGEGVVILDPEAVTAAAHALGIVCGRMIAGASDKTGRAIIQTMIERAAMTANATAAAERADAAREAATLADKLAESVALIEDFEFDGEPRLVLAAPDIAKGLNAKRLVTMQSLALDTRTAAAILREGWAFRVANLADWFHRMIAETWGVTTQEFAQARKDYDALRADERRRAREADLQSGDYRDSAHAAQFGPVSGARA